MAVTLTDDERNLVLQLLADVKGNLLHPDCPALMKLVWETAGKLRRAGPPKAKKGGKRRAGNR